MQTFPKSVYNEILSEPDRLKLLEVNMLFNDLETVRVTLHSVQLFMSWTQTKCDLSFRASIWLCITNCGFEQASNLAECLIKSSGVDCIRLSRYSITCTSCLLKHVPIDNSWHLNCHTGCGSAIDCRGRYVKMLWMFSFWTYILTCSHVSV